MINAETDASDKPLPDTSTGSTEAQDCASLFCSTLANLNKISEEHIRVLLNIAYTAAELFCSLSSSKPDEATESAARTKSEELTALAGHLRSAAEGVSKSFGGRQAEIAVGEPGATANPEAFCQKVEAALSIAMQNSVSNQLQLNITGQAILAMAAAKLLSIAAPGNSEVPGTQEVSK